VKTFEKLTNRYSISCTFTSVEGLHIGTGVPSADSDAPFIREADEAFLPGSSLRGALRSTVERILAGLFVRQICCTPFVENDATVCHAGNKAKRTEYETATGPELEKLLPDMKLCPVCELFGSTLKAAKLKISDARQVVGQGNEVEQPVRRDGVGIDRDTETAHPQIKFNYEVLASKVKFKCLLEVENAEEADFALLYILIQELKSGIDVGGRKSRGLGRIKLANYQVEYIDSDHPLVEYLKGSRKGIAPATFEEKLRDHFEKSVRALKGGHENVAASDQ
jgi:CRISPR-associated RAMP protein (TIGR02581 family)